MDTTPSTLTRQRRETRAEYASRLWATWRLAGYTPVLPTTTARALAAPYGATVPDTGDTTSLASVALAVAAATPAVKRTPR